MPILRPRNQSPSQAARFILGLVNVNRQETAEARPMPITRHNIAFGRTEHTGELLDAYLLRPVGEYQRNRDKKHTPARELAQAMHQIASALITARKEPPPIQPDPWVTLHGQIEVLLCTAQEAWERGDGKTTREILGLALVRAVELADLMGLDPVGIVEDENARILSKIATTQESATHA